MPNPWLVALKLIPWASLLANGPAMAKAADALLSGAKTKKARAPAGADEIHSLSERVAALETHTRADAELGKQMSDQIQALTKATEVLAVRQRWLVVGVVVVSVGLLAALLLR